MKRRKWLYVALCLIIMGLSIRILLTLFLEPWTGKKLETILSEKNPNYEIQISKVHISLFFRKIELSKIIINSKIEDNKHLYINGKIASVRLKGLSIIKAVFKNSIDIRSVSTYESGINIITPTITKDRPSIIIPVNINIDRLFLDKTQLLVRNKLNSSSYSLNEGIIKVHNISFYAQDTFSIEKLQNFEFTAEKVASVSSDSMYTYDLKGMVYSSVSNNLSADTFSILPNFSDYGFTSRFEFQKDRIEAQLSNISIHNFNIPDYLSSGRLSCTYSEAGNLDLKVFRDKRKEFRHINKPEFQDMIYSYPGFIKLDTISILNGNITYKEHVEKANEPGYITFNKIDARIYNITNDSIFLTEKAFLELRCSALLMGKGKIDILLKSRLFDSRNLFSVNGTLTAMDISEMNPYLENNAFIYVTSGILNKVDFSFTATHTESNGTMTVLYNGLDLAVKNKNTDDTTAFRERLITLFANIKVLDSNPLPGNEVREGIIKKERDPERFLFSYFAQSFLSGIKSTLLRNNKDE